MPSTARDGLAYIMLVTTSLFLAGNCQLQCFNGSLSECNGGVVSGVSTAQDCCLGDGYWFKTAGSQTCMQCIVHGFVRTNIAGQEGKTVRVLARTYLKGEPESRPTTPLRFSFKASPKTAGKEDFRAVLTIVIFRDRRRPFSTNIQLRLDEDALEGNETIEVKLTARRLPANAFLIDRMEVVIIDTTCAHSQSEWSSWERVPLSSITTDQCVSGTAFRQRRTRAPLVDGCDSENETRLVCMPEDEDRIIRGLGLGSIGFDVGSINDPPSQPPVTEDPTNTTNTPNTRRRRQEGFTRLQIPGGRCPGQSPGVGRICDNIDNDQYACNLPQNLGPKKTIPRSECIIQTILLILDTSGSVSSGNFERMKTAMSNIIPYLCAKIQVAAITFSSDVHLEFCFNCFDNTATGRSAIRDAILGISYRGGGTQTGRATRCVIHDLLTAGCGLHPSTSCIDVIYITDGQSGGPLSVCDEVRCLHNSPSLGDITNVYAIGVGNVNPNEIRCIAGEDDDTIFSTQNFDEFEQLITSTTNRLDSDSSLQCFESDETTDEDLVEIPEKELPTTFG